MANVLVLNGPNLNLLGTREPEKYGHDTLQNIEDRLASLASDHQIAFFQSNVEGELINRIHQAQVDKVDFILINPAAFTHTSIALRDAMLAVNIPFIEIHLSNVYARESFRHHSYLSDIAVAVISGLGAQGYELALAAALSRVAETED
ncbi:MAG: type II 3-dehydroquinate dehydratase [Sedimenticolaceae bacterium]|jgi:3-dehydroquinate dehydratase-2